MEKLSESPFSVEDLIDPADPEPEDKIFSNAIPIRTWSRGKRVGNYLFDHDESHEEFLVASGTENNLADYFPQASDVPTEDEDVFNEDIQEDCELATHDKNINIDSKMEGNYDDDFDTDDDIPEDRDLIVDNTDQSNIENDDDPGELSEEFIDGEVFIASNNMEENYGQEPEYRTPSQENNMIQRQIGSMVRELDDVMSALTTNVDNYTVPRRLSMTSRKDSHSDVLIDQATIDMSVFDNESEDDDDDHGILRNEMYESPTNLSGENILAEPPKRRYKHTPGIFNGKVVKASGYGPVDQQKRRKEQIWKDRQKNFNAKTKARETLMEIALKRKINEEVYLYQKLKEDAVKRKFRENLERISQAKQIGESAIPGFLAPTKAYENQTQVTMSKKKAAVELDHDLATKIEEEKREKIACDRRRFKEKHRIILEKLVQKNKDIEKKMADDKLMEERRKEKYQRRIAESIAKLVNVTQINRLSNIGDTNEVLNEGRRRESSAPPLSTEKLDTGEQSNTRRRAAGSALAAIRSQRPSGKQNTELTQTAMTPSAVPTFQAFKENEEERLQANRKRNESSKHYQEKMSAYLSQLAEEKKEEEAKTKKLEERKKKRAYLLSMRLLSEASERKAMAAEDHLRVRESDNVVMETDAKKTKTKTYCSDIDPQPTILKETDKNEGKNSRAAVAVAKLKDKGAPMSKIPSLLNILDDDDDNDNVSVAQSQQKLTSEMTEALISRLTKPSVKAATTTTSATGEEIIVSTAPYRDYNDWKRKNNVSADTKVFCMTGWYPCVKQALLDRGWVMNKDPNSPYCDMKWTLKSTDVNQETLQPWQLTNHFCKNMAITTKAGLIKSLQPLSWMVDVPCTDIYPRGYDLSNPDEMLSFIDDFRCQRAASILKGLFEQVTGQSKLSSPLEFSLDDNMNQSQGSDRSECHVNRAVFETCCEVLERYLRPFNDDFLDSDQRREIEIAITPLEWEIIGYHDIYNVSTGLPDDPLEAVDAFLTTSNAVGALRRGDDPMHGTLSHSSSGRYLGGIPLSKKRFTAADTSKSREVASDNIRKLIPLTTAELKRVNAILSTLQTVEGIQAGINGWGSKSKNLWIVKPAAKSRGRGIATFNDLPKLLKYVEAGSGFSSQWIVQKYMENPLLIANRKFDFRQWVLVTDWNPLTVYFYDEFYVRFSVEAYNTSDEALENAFIHLVNNSIGKNSENFSKVVQTEYGVDLEGYMLTYAQMRDHIVKLTGEDLVKTKIQPRMKDIARWSLMSASEMIEHRKNSWELYGFDYMIDDEFNPWLIEINSSPACDYSTKVTEVYVQKALVEILNVVLDLKKWETTSKSTRGDRPNTGGWECIYKGPLFEKPIASLGSDMTIKGKGYKVPNNSSQSVSGQSSMPFTSKIPTIRLNSNTTTVDSTLKAPTRRLAVGAAKTIELSSSTPNEETSVTLETELEDLESLAAVFVKQSSATNEVKNQKLMKTIDKKKELSHKISNLSRAADMETMTDSVVDDSCDDLPDLDSEQKHASSLNERSQVETSLRNTKVQTNCHKSKIPTNAVPIPVKVFQIEL